jgi:hypothetical protein
MATIEEKANELASRLEIHAPNVWAKGEFELNNLAHSNDLAVTTLLITVVIGRLPNGRASPMDVSLSCNEGMETHMINYALQRAMVDEGDEHAVRTITLDEDGELKDG